MRTTLENLQKPLGTLPTKICSAKVVCKGVPLPNTQEYFYKGQSSCIACKAKQSKEYWAERKANRENYYGF